MTGITAYDGKTGWKIEPWQGKKDVEPLGEDELKEILEDADFDGPLVHYKEKGNTVEFVGTEPVEGTDAYKLKVTLKNGDVQYYYMDTDYFVPIKIEMKRIVRGRRARVRDHRSATTRKSPACTSPTRSSQGRKGSANRVKVVYDKIEANVPLDDSALPASRAGAGGWRSEARDETRRMLARHLRGHPRRRRCAAPRGASPPAAGQGRLRDHLRPRRAQHRLGHDERAHRRARRRARGRRA